MRNVRKKSVAPAPPPFHPRESIRASRLVPLGLFVLAVLAGLAWLILRALEKPPAKPVASMQAAADSPSPSPAFGRAEGPLPAPLPLSVPHIVEPLATEKLLSEQGPDCLSCAKTNGCLDPAQPGGGSCDDVPGEASGCGAGVTERDICYKTMKDVFLSKCAETLQETPCLCGATDVVGCIDGTATPTGPILPDYRCDFKTNDATRIYRDFRETAYGAGRANMLIQCVAGYDCKCFGN